MAFKEVIALTFACILANNYVLSSFFGVESVAVDSLKDVKDIVRMGLTVTAVLVLSTLITWPVNNALACVIYLQTLVFAVITVAVVFVVDILARKASKGHDCNVIPVALNSIVLGACLVNASNGYGYGTSLLVSVGAGLGYLLTTLVVAAVRERINEKYVPKAWRGAPILVAEMAIISMVLFAL